MTPETQTMLREIESIKADGRAVCAGLSDTQFNWRPGPGRWSVAECLVHLYTAVTATLPAFDRAIDAGRARGPKRQGGGPFRYGWFSRWMVRSMEPPPKRKMPTFKVFDVPPDATYVLADVLPAFAAVRDQLAERVRLADGLDWGGVRVISPVNRLLRLPLGAYFQFVIAHDRRHVWQARQVRATPEFGGS
jgi:hypothetical protein